MRHAAALRKSETGRLAIASAGLGALVGGTHELWEALFHCAEEEMLAYMLMEVMAGAAIGAVVFFCVSLLYTTVSKVGVRTPQSKKWDPIGLFLCGAFVGTMLVLVHEIYDVIMKQSPQADPFLHIMAEMSLLAVSSAILFAGIAMVRNRMVQASSIVGPTRAVGS